MAEEEEPKRASITGIKQKILDKIDSLVDGIKGVTTDADIAKADQGKMLLMNMLISSLSKLNSMYVDDDDDDDVDEEDDADAE